MPTDTGRAFTTANLLPNLAALKAVNFGAADPTGVWFVLLNPTTSNIEFWVWQPDSIVAPDETSVIRPDSIAPGSPGRCIQRLKFDASQLAGILAAITALTTTGLIERTAEGGAVTTAITDFIKTLLNDADAGAARSTLGLSEVATRMIGTSGGQLRDAADLAYSDARIPLSHAGTHLAGGGDSLGLGDVAFRSIGNSTGQIRDAADGAYSNARTPTSHASTHAVGGTDVVPVFGYLAVSANTTLTIANQRQLIDVNTTTGAITVTLPAAVTVGSGWAVQIRKSDASANLVTIARSGTDTINGATSLPLAVQHQSFILFSLGSTSWGVVAGFPGTLPANTLLGRGATAGPPETIASSGFASSSALATKADLIGGFVPSSQLPSYVDDVLEFATLVGFPTTGETGKIYIAIDTNLTYRWTGSTYAGMSSSLALGTTSTTAYRGDFGNTAYLHSQITSGNPHEITATTINLENLTNVAQVDLSTDQEVGGNKRFANPILIGLNTDLSVKSYTDTVVKKISSAVINTVNHFAGSLTFANNPNATFGFFTTDFDINSATSIALTPVISCGHFRLRNFGTGQVTSLQGLRLTAQNNGTGNVTTLDGAFFNARNDGIGSTVTTLNGGNFNASLIVASTATTINAGNFTASAVASSNATTVRGLNITASSSNTTPATNCIGIDIANITGTATNKLAIRTGLGRVVFGDTTQATSTTSAAVTMMSLGVAGTIIGERIILPTLPTSPTGLATGSLWRNGNVINIV